MGIKSNIINVLFISILIDFLEFTIILPLLPKILTYYGSQVDANHDTLYHKTMSFVQFIRDLTGAPNDAKWNSVLFGGIIGSLFSLLQFFSSTLCGIASDRYGRKSVLLFSMVGISLSYALWCVSFNLTIFMLARVVSGLSKANVAIILAIVSDTTTEKERNRAMAWIGAAFSLGFIFGPLLGAFCSQLAIIYWPASSISFFILPACVSLVLSLINIGFISKFCPETLPISKRNETKTSITDVYNAIFPWRLFKFSTIHNIKSKHDVTILRRLGIASFLYMIVFAGLEFTITFLVYNRFNWNSMQQGKMFFLMGLCMAVVQGGYVRRIPDGKEITAAMTVSYLNQDITCIIMGIKSNIINVLFISILIDFLEFTIILPLLPKILTYYGSQVDANHDTLYHKTMSFVQFIRDITGAPNDAKWNSVLFGGIIGSLFSLLQFFSSTLCGIASDRYGRKSVLLLSMVGISLSYALWCVSFNLTIFMLARVVSGLSKANVAIILAIVSDTTTEKERNRAMAWIGAAFSLGFIFGPLLGAFCSQLAIIYWPASSVSFFILPACVSLVLSLINIGFISKFCPETLPISKRNETKTSITDVYNAIFPWRLFKFSTIHNIKSKHDVTILRRLGIASFLYMIVFAGLEFTITFLVYNRFNWNSMQQGKMFFVMGLCMAVVQGGYVRRIPDGKEITAAMTVSYL
ncbi:unnamed protein product [Adineta steineri]|uniref:Major facilitator superfamily (MFS) profile domain-containing protein n=2 Tax=Adineta steineri TaxID=433720 RepID=A0A814H165_9BILA|nr:unnamed protein product [Adineta steineri]